MHIIQPRPNARRELLLDNKKCYNAARQQSRGENGRATKSEWRKRARKWTLRYEMSPTRGYLCNLASTRNSPKFFPTSAVIRSRRICRLFLQTILNWTEMWEECGRKKKSHFKTEILTGRSNATLHCGCFCLNPAHSYLFKKKKKKLHHRWVIICTPVFDGLKE